MEHEQGHWQGCSLQVRNSPVARDPSRGSKILRPEVKLIHSQDLGLLRCISSGTLE